MGTEGPDDLVIIDDHPGELRLIEEVIESAEIETALYTVTQKEEAFELLLPDAKNDDVLQPDAVLLDWNLEEGTGQEVLLKIKENQPTTTVAIMTSAELQQEKIQSVASQADSYFTKPSSPEEYIEIIKSFSN